MTFYWVYKVIFTGLSVGLFLFSFRKTYQQMKEYNEQYKKLPDNLKSYINERAKRGVKNGLKENKGLIAVNILLIIILLGLNIIIWFFIK